MEKASVKTEENQREPRQDDGEKVLDYDELKQKIQEEMQRQHNALIHDEDLFESVYKRYAEKLHFWCEENPGKNPSKFKFGISIKTTLSPAGGGDVGVFTILEAPGMPIVSNTEMGVVSIQQQLPGLE